MVPNFMIVCSRFSKLIFSVLEGVYWLVFRKVKGYDKDYLKKKHSYTLKKNLFLIIFFGKLLNIQ